MWLLSLTYRFPRFVTKKLQCSQLWWSVGLENGTVIMLKMVEIIAGATPSVETNADACHDEIVPPSGLASAQEALWKELVHHRLYFISLGFSNNLTQRLGHLLYVDKGPQYSAIGIVEILAIIYVLLLPLNRAWSQFSNAFLIHCFEREIMRTCFYPSLHFELLILSLLFGCCGNVYAWKLVFEARTNEFMDGISLTMRLYSNLGLVS